jgi:Uma2 family endonuclease
MGKTSLTTAAPQSYAIAGIPEYWIVNLKTMELMVMRHPNGGVYKSATTWKQGTITPLRFPDLEVSVERLLD